MIYHAVAGTLHSSLLVVEQNGHFKWEVAIVGPEDHAIKEEAQQSDREVSVAGEQSVVEQAMLLEEGLVGNKSHEKGSTNSEAGCYMWVAPGIW